MACKYNKIRKFNTDIHVLEVNPREYEILLVATDGNKLATVPNIQNDYMIENGYTRAAAINGGFFQSNGQSNGWEYTDYQFVNSIGWEDGVMDLLWQNHKLIIDDVNERRFNEKFKGFAQWGVSASYALVIDGAINLQGKDKFSHHTSYNPRTFIGQKADGTVLLMVCDGRNKNNSVGLTATQQASVCLELGCKNAINLDGGGSSTFEYNGQIKNAPTDGSLRKVSNAIVVYEKESTVSKPVEGVGNMKKLVLDAGHSMVTPGKQTTCGVKEWYMNNNVCNFVEESLKDYEGIQVYRTDDTSGNTDISLSNRVSACNKINPDLMISVHHNAGGGTGTEVYWHSKGTQADKKVAELLAPKLSNHTGMRNRGVKQASFTVLGCNATAILSEGGFMDTKSDIDIIKSWGQKAYADAIVETVVEYLGLTKKVIVEEIPKDEPAETKTLFRVSVGSYLRDTAEKMKQELISKGYKDTFLTAVQVNK